jgi:hypothetical protein
MSYVEECYKKTLDNSSTCKSILWYTFNVMLSGSYLDFSTFVKTTNGNLDSGIGPHTNTTFERLVVPSNKKYLNMAASNRYLLVYLKDTQLTTLTANL